MILERGVYSSNGLLLNETVVMKEKILALLFVGIFAAIGFGILFVSVIPSLVDAWQMKRWYNTPATLTAVKLETRSDDDSTTYQATARYSYRFNGTQYQGSRITISGGFDNVGDYHEQMVDRLKRAYNSGQQITVWVNPDNPQESIIDNKLRLEMFAFKMLFVVLFGGFGAVGIYMVLYKQSTFKAPVGEEANEKPWLLEEKWASPTIYSDGKTAMLGIWFFAVFWNLVSSPLIFIIPKEFGKGNHMALIGLLFPLVGAGLFVAAIKKTLQWQRFGRTPLHMDPYPGSIGGHVGGHIDVPLPYSETNLFKVSLNQIHSYVSGSGDDRSRKESIKWQDSGIATTEPLPNGTRVWVRFDVPAGMKSSQQVSDNYYLWRLTLTAELSGVDYDRNYEIPVFETAESSRNIKQSTTETAASIEHKYRAIEGLIDPVPKAGGVEWFQPAGRNPGMAFGLLVFGAVFTTAGWFLATEKQVFMSVIFSTVGILIVASGFYTVLNSLWVRVDGDKICRKRRFMGITINSQQIGIEQIKGLSVEQGATSGTTVYYNVFVRTEQGKKHRIAEGFKGRSEAELAKESLEILIPDH